MAVLLFKWFSIFLMAGMGYFPEENRKSSFSHPFFVSVTEINHNAGDKNLEISCKIFTDDFETALTKSTGTKVDLFNPRDKQLAEKQIAAYIKKHLVMKLDNKPVTLEFVGFERESEAVWSYLQVAHTSAPKKIEINNDLLYDAFDQQINLIHISVGGNRKSTKLNYPDANASFQF
jgi:hypothetical protein